MIHVKTTVECDRCGERGECDKGGHFPASWSGVRDFGADLCDQCTVEVSRAIGGAIVSETETVQKKRANP